MTDKNSSQKFEIDISQPSKAFTEHLNISGNRRIIFSAPFGTGKTYFLKKYFENDGDQVNPSVFHLYPVNYSVSRNEDIFELIKYDLFLQLLDPKRGLEFGDEDYSLAQRIWVELNNPENDPISSGLFNVIPKIGPTLNKAANYLPTVMENLTKKKKMEDQKGDAGKYKSQMEKTLGSIYEANAVTDLLKDLIAKLKEEHTEAILILDDLDRIDPEHIFRLLNVFAAHFDINEEENKFGFDQVILVCDIENIRKIFHNKFGQDTDFSGYIDKFYSREVFVFDNTPLVINLIDQILSTTLIHPTHVSNFSLNNIETNENFILKETITRLLRINGINLRVLLKLYDLSYRPPVYEVSLKKNVKNTHIAFLAIFDFLRTFFGTSIGLLNALEKLKNDSYNNNELLGNLLMICMLDEIDFKKINESYIYYQPEGHYEFKIIKTRSCFVGEYKTIYNLKNPIMHEQFFKFFYLAAKKLVSLRILK